MRRCCSVASFILSAVVYLERQKNDNDEQELSSTTAANKCVIAFNFFMSSLMLWLANVDLKRAG